MKSFEIVFGARLRLNYILGAASGPEGRLHFLPVIDQLVFSDEDWERVRQVTIGTQTTYSAPYDGFGKVTVTLADAQAEALVRELENSPLVTCGDWRSWVSAVVEQLKVGAPVGAGCQATSTTDHSLVN